MSIASSGWKKETEEKKSTAQQGLLKKSANSEQIANPMGRVFGSSSGGVVVSSIIGHQSMPYESPIASPARKKSFQNITRTFVNSPQLV